MPMIPFKPAALAVALLSLGVAGTVAYAPSVSAQAKMDQREVPAGQAFPFLEKYLSLPASERDHIEVAYAVKIKNGNASQAQLLLKYQGQSQKLNIASDGRITPLPTLTQLRGGAKVYMSAPADMSVSMKVRIFAKVPAAKTMAVAPLIKAVDQTNRSARKIAGVLAVAVPKQDRLYFAGAGNGRVVMADGSTKPLPKTHRADVFPAGTPFFVPADFPGAVSLSFDAVPNRISIDDRLK